MSQKLQASYLLFMQKDTFTTLIFIFSFARRHLRSPDRPSDGGLEEVHGGAGGGSLLLHRVQGPPQEPGPDRQLGRGGQAVGQQPAEAGLQPKQPEPTAEGRAVSFSKSASALLRALSLP